tara:strand:- start:415 stop:546 length:132 start_codon:yes stop_codon:yes gene_type:complete
VAVAVVLLGVMMVVLKTLVVAVVVDIFSKHSVPLILVLVYQSV